MGDHSRLALRPGLKHCFERPQAIGQRNLFINPLGQKLLEAWLVFAGLVHCRIAAGDIRAHIDQIPVLLVGRVEMLEAPRQLLVARAADPGHHPAD